MTNFSKRNKFSFTLFLTAVIFACFPLNAAPRVSNQRQKLIDYGLTLQGIRYRYGGKKPETGFDCSGFVSYVAKESLGVKISASAAQMYETVEHIDESEREPGDLIFFFLHAASDGPRTGVIVSSIDERYWKNHFKGYARILPATVITSTGDSDGSEKIMEYSDETEREPSED